jgi:hypothetical protein
MEIIIYEKVTIVKDIFEGKIRECRDPHTSVSSARFASLQCLSPVEINSTCLMLSPDWKTVDRDNVLFTFLSKL